MAIMKKIPQDIIIDILHRLPAKSVGLSRCVSKEWLSLLSDPRFIQTHPKTLSIMFGYRYSFSYHSVPLNNLETVSRHWLGNLIFERHGSVNGLILVSKFAHSGSVFILFLFNPTTTDYVELPVPKQQQLYGMLGFGYDSMTDDYKVVNISCTGKYPKNYVYVYSLRTNTWKQQVTDLPYDHCYKRLSGVFVNGFLYWIVKSQRHSKLVIVAFSLADEKLNELPPPKLYDEVDVVSVIGTKLIALGGKLAIFDDVKGYFWLMNEYGVERSWTKIVVHGYNERPMIRTFNGWVEVRLARPKVFYDNGKFLFLTANQLGIYDRLWIYDVEEQTFSKSIDISYMNIKHDYVICAYAESLSLPHQNSADRNRTCQIQWKRNVR